MTDTPTPDDLVYGPLEAARWLAGVGLPAEAKLMTDLAAEVERLRDENTALQAEWHAMAGSLSALDPGLTADEFRQKYLADVARPTPNPEPKPSDGPDYHADHEAWQARQEER